MLISRKIDMYSGLDRRIEMHKDMHIDKYTKSDR